LEEIVLRENVQLLVCTLPDGPDSESHLRQTLARCQELNIQAQIFADTPAAAQFQCEFDSFSDSFRVSPKPKWSRAVQTSVKSVVDMLAGLTGSLVTLLMTPIVALLINLEDPGPVFYRREFVGSDGGTRYYLKFRTMVRNADEILQKDPKLKARFLGNYKLREDPRVLRIGRFLRKYSIDEFPQFFSLFRGQMTLVGPRVIAREEKDRYGDLLPKRLSVKPGITGYWQVMGRQNTSYTERIQMDMFYIDHWSIWLDVYIVLKTVAKVIRPEGAY